MTSTKYEIRSTKQYQNSNGQMAKTFRILNFCHLNLFRISDLGFRIFHLDDGQNGRFPTGFTLVEAAVSLIIVSAMLVAALSTVGASRLSQHKSSLGSRGQLLAESLMAEILRQDYQDPDIQGVFGCESGESTSTRADFDDVDDYHGWSSSPPVDKNGSLIWGLTNWKRSVTVEWVDPLDLGQVKLSETNVKKVTVTVSYDDVLVASLVGIRSAYGL
jgi:type II secretory pathway pseudopilin PulG